VRHACHELFRPIERIHDVQAVAREAKLADGRVELRVAQFDESMFSMSGESPRSGTANPARRGGNSLYWRLVRNLGLALVNIVLLTTGHWNAPTHRL